MSEKQFTKHDQGKPQLTLVDKEFIIGTCRVLELGVINHGFENWKKCDDVTRFKDALLRHTLAYTSGERIDSDSGLSHAFHISCNAMFLDYFDRLND